MFLATTIARIRLFVAYIVCEAIMDKSQEGHSTILDFLAEHQNKFLVERGTYLWPTYLQ